jgi:GTPase
MNNLVAIVGRPNVGKSTLFNRLIGERKAIMDNESGVTRDRHYGYSEWCGKNFTVIDTGGYVEGSDDVFEGAIRRQVELALEEANVVLMVVDCTEGLHPLDREFAHVIRKSGKPTLIVANKDDTGRQGHYFGEFYELGLESEVWSISAMTGSGTGDLLDEVVKHLPANPPEDPDEGIARVAVIGRPNVGKSSFTNTLLGTERNIVTDIAGTTRDAIDARYNAFGHEFILTDTAGLRRKSRLRDEQIEFYSTLRAITAIERSDVCLVLLDATRGLEAQDITIILTALEAKKGVVLVVNKWDIYENKSEASTREFEATIRERLPTLSYLPIVFVSAHTKQRVLKAVETMIQVHDARRRKLPTSQLNAKLLPDIEAYPPPIHKGKSVSIKYITQLPVYTPTFAFYCNLPQYVQESYQRYLENKLRSHFDFTGVPITLVFKKK